MAVNLLEKQMLELSGKVDVLHGLVEQLTHKITDMATSQSYSHSDKEYGAIANLPPVTHYRTVDPSMVHKDVLSDEPYLEGDKSSSSQNLSPEIQIQRLTAQLTAAYNRMAALEEQILACRFH
jgi:hypothetical protein